MSNNLTAEHPKKFVNSSNKITQIIDDFNQLDLKYDSSLNEIVKELYNKYNEEYLICEDLNLVINSLDQVLAEKKQNPDSIINWCLDNQNDSIAHIILARCYRFGKWIEKNEHKAYIHYQKSADMEFADGIYNVGVCYTANMGYSDAINRVGDCYLHGYGVEVDEYMAFVYYKKLAEL
ncbi:HCP-like protein [Gigaspora margarita]|uniref:HCP-like protein n=1 Tax=Gigaspora margarita TaxID=4874 RepID=A0A8H4A6B2_GIGMA|nr:HCP-like protein [Gigaspora margarita]